MNLNQSQPGSAGMRVIGYVRVSTDKQEIGPEVQVAALTEAAARRGWQLEIRREDAASAASMRNRPILASVLADLKAHRADLLAVSKLDRLSRSVADFGALLEASDRQRWELCCLDIDVDTTTPTGRAFAQVMVTFAEFERRRIGERTREGMARIKAETGKHMGRPGRLPEASRSRVHELRSEGLSLEAIAARLNDEAVPTSAGGRWWPGTVSRALAVA